MFFVPLVVLIILNGELIRVLRQKKAKRAQLLHGRTSLAGSASAQPPSVATATAAAAADDDTRRCVADVVLSTRRIKHSTPSGFEKIDFTAARNLTFDVSFLVCGGGHKTR